MSNKDTTQPIPNNIEDYIGVKLPVLDHGYVMLIATHLGDEDVVHAARKSTGSGGTSVKGLLRYLSEHKHTVPFEFPAIYLRLRLPLYVQAQLVRHRTASLVQLSMRATVTKPAMHCAESRWRLQTTKNKMGSDGLIVDPDTIAGLDEDEAMLQRVAYEVYERRIAAGVAKEQARKDLPQSVYTEVDWTIDLHNFLNVLSQRTDPHAQQEIREYANAMLRIAETWVPHTIQAWKDYKRNALTLSAMDQEVIRQVMHSSMFCGVPPGALMDEKEKLRWLTDRGAVFPARMKDRERAQVYDKLEQFWNEPS